MIQVFTTVSKYICILLMILYTYCSFRYLSMSDEEQAEGMLSLERPIILLMHFLYSVVLILNIASIEACIFFAAQFLYLILYPIIFKKIYPSTNMQLLNSLCLCLSLGMLMLERLSFSKSVRQAFIILGSSLLALLIPYIIDKVWDFARFRYALCILGIVLLSTVFLLGATSYGAKMSISIAGFSFQASEFVKISFVFAMAGFLYYMKRQGDFLITILMAGLHVLVLVLCRDLGTALLFFASFLAMLYIATNRKSLVFLGGILAALAGTLSYFLFSHVRTRVFAFLDPWADIDNRGYQITQSLFAIGTGGLFGLGLYQGLPNRIPIVEKDFMISAISEEMGAILAVCLILVCLSIFIQIMLIATDMEFGFYKLVAVGLGVQYIIQVFLTVGGAIKFIPSTGVTLPFMSYGGSSMIASFIVLAIIQGLYIIQGDEDDLDEIEEEDAFED